jgi:hypothetical protein
MMASIFDSVSNFVGNVGDVISITFREIANFIKDVIIVGLNIYFAMIVLLFFGLIFLAIYLPVKALPYFLKIKAMYYRFFEKIGRAQNHDK